MQMLRYGISKIQSSMILYKESQKLIKFSVRTFTFLMTIPMFSALLKKYLLIYYRQSNIKITMTLFDFKIKSKSKLEIVSIHVIILTFKKSEDTYLLETL